MILASAVLAASWALAKLRLVLARVEPVLKLIVAKLPDPLAADGLGPKVTHVYVKSLRALLFGSWSMYPSLHCICFWDVPRKGPVITTPVSALKSPSASTIVRRFGS